MMEKSTRSALVAALILLARPGDPVRGGLVITPTFDTSITSNANAAQLEADITAAISIYQTLYSDPINVSIVFRYANTSLAGNPLASGTLAVSNYGIYTGPYINFINALIADKKSANDNIAVAHLPPASAFPNVPTNMVKTSANARAVGLIAAPVLTVPGIAGTFDGAVTINSNQPFQLDRTGGIALNKFDIMQSIEHEIDEVLGLSSILPSTKDFNQNNAIRPEDLFRYSAPNTISLTSSGTASSYFSIDGGATSLVALNQNSSGDFGDWASPTPMPFVQLAFTSRGTQSDVSRTSPEGIALDVIGYDLVQAPEPMSFALWMSAVVAGCGWRSRTRLGRKAL